MIEGLRETARPAQLLMELLWAEEGVGHPASSPVWGFAKTLLTKGFVERLPHDELKLRITDKGREVARQLERTPAGIAYKNRNVDK